MLSNLKEQKGASNVNKLWPLPTPKGVDNADNRIFFNHKNEKRKWPTAVLCMF